MWVENIAQQVPLAFVPERGAEVAGLFENLSAKAAELIAGTAGSSQYLSGLLVREQNWLQSTFKAPLDDAFQSVLDDIDPVDLGRSLRIAKGRAALLIALADLGGLWDLDQVTQSLSKLADRCIGLGLSQLLAREFERGKLPMCTEVDLETDCGMSVIGMGKLGACELNYSSDIDLIVLFDETRFDPDDYAQVRKTFVRVTQALVKLLSENTADGYVFRTDLRLRPDPSVTPVCIAMVAAEHYYESLGRTWERAAMIKARPVAGDLKAGEQFLERLKPFIWRRHLDFAAIQDAQDMLLKIREHKGLQGELNFPGHDMKLGRGGIREIEFFAQTHQLIFGGRDMSLRDARTVATLDDLATSARVDRETAAQLSAAYKAHRSLEHRIQMLDDAQTHLIPKSPEKLQQLANLCGFASSADLASDMVPRLLEVHQNTKIERIGADSETIAPQADEITGLFEEREQTWFALSALRNGRSREIYTRLRPALINRFSTVSQPETALLRFEQFLSGLPSGVQVFSLFESTPTLLDLVVDICAISPALAEYLGRNKSVLDAVLDRDFFQPFPTQEFLQARVDALLVDAVDYEQVLDLLRRWQKEAHFRNGVHLLRGISTPREAGQVYSTIAQVSVAALLPHVEAHLANRFGPAPGRGAAILAMGKLGSCEMTASSDLDLIVIYDAKGVSETSGPKQLSVGAYFSRFTQALISALTVPTSEGSLYEVDMRLRPSGRNGPVATSLSSFAEYQLNEAWTWEHLALTRARVISGRKDLGADVEQAIDDALLKSRGKGESLHDINEMRDKLATAFAESSPDIWEAKKGPGRILDIELCVQAGALINSVRNVRSPLDMIPQLQSKGWLSESEGAVLALTHQLLSSVQQIERLVGSGFNPTTGAARLQEILCRVTGAPNVTELATRLDDLTRSAEALIKQKLGAD